MKKSENRTALVTGAANGIGRACAERFLAEGWNVVSVDLAGVDASGDREMVFTADVADRSRMEAIVGEAVERFGAIDCVVACAGIHRSNTMLEVSDSELELMINTNIYGTIRTLQASVPAMTRGGSIVIMASDQSTVGKAHSFAYGLTKGALGQMAKSLAIDLAPRGIRVNAVCPGTIDTPLMRSALARCAGSEAELRELTAEENALFLRGSVGRPAEVAAMVYFLASDEAGFCTGGLYPVDGGYTCR